MRRFHLLAWFLLLACAAPQRAPASTAGSGPVGDPLEEAEALAVIDELLVDSQLTPVDGWQIELPPHERFHVDVRLGDSSFGIEWVSRGDRQMLGSTLPPTDPEGPLRLVHGRAGDAAGKPLILVLDAQSYDRSTPAKNSAPVARDRARERLRRDVTEFLDYVRGQL